MSLPTDWRRRLKLPLIVAPMTTVSQPELASTVCRSGAIGSFPSHNATTTDELSRWLTAINAELEESRRQTGATPAPLAVNVVVHRSNRRVQADIECLAAHRTELVIASVGNPTAIVAPVHAAGGLVFADVATMRHVDRAISAGVDGLILLTAGAGGQTGSLNPLAFVRAARERYDGPLVLAGGIADGTALWAAEVLGADLAYMGTRFIATLESGAAEAYKQAVVDAGPDQIELTTAVSGLPTNLLAGRPGSGRDSVDIPGGFDQDRLLAVEGLWSAGHSVTGATDIVAAATLVRRTQREYLAARDRRVQPWGRAAEALADA